MDLESELARSAIQRLRSWRERVNQEKKGGFIPRLAVKFCGGCNPLFDRERVVRKLREGISGIRWVSWEQDPDLTLILNGCPTACAEREEVRKHCGASLEIQPGAVLEVEECRRIPEVRGGREKGGRGGGS